MEAGADGAEQQNERWDGMKITGCSLKRGANIEGDAERGNQPNRFITGMSALRTAEEASSQQGSGSRWSTNTTSEGLHVGAGKPPAAHLQPGTGCKTFHSWTSPEPSTHPASAPQRWESHLSMCQVYVMQAWSMRRARSCQLWTIHCISRQEIVPPTRHVGKC